MDVPFLWVPFIAAVCLFLLLLSCFLLLTVLMVLLPCPFLNFFWKLF